MPHKPTHMVVTSRTRLISIRVPHDLLDLIPEDMGQTEFILAAMEAKLVAMGKLEYADD